MKVAARVNLTKPSAMTASPAGTKVARARPPPISTADEVSSVGPESPPSNSKSSSRSRRGCRFRLINILFSPEFSSRWDEMRDAPTSESDEANAFWISVHTAFLSEPSSYGQLQFDDELFANVNPALVVLHTAQKLQQMWQEMTSLYRRAVNSAYADFKSNHSKVKPFFHYCAGRLDLLYIHMGLLLSPKLVESVVNNPRKALFLLNHTNSTAPTSTSETKRVVKSGKQLSPGQRSEDRRGSGAGNFVNEVIPKTPKLVELQNPELLPDWLIEDQAKTAAARGDFVSASLVGESVRKNPRAHKKSKASQMISSSVSPIFASPSSVPVDPPMETTDLVLHSSAINSIDDGYVSSDYEASGGYQFSRKPAPKRRRQESTEIVEFPMTRELVPHSHKRMHTAVTTTMTRSQEVTLPPDEFDVLHNRLRKMNECIDECYRTLSSPDGILNEMHRQDVEGDLQFYTSIKKRIQQQLMMAMSGF
ncbi:hypothetical protein Poli38472_012492 [Pythium oligandrum]|uniref:Uncharacterized protein n=1 Tax=Pythium oligandrum TaxID=41045 RepID=A0A8K1CRK2_PYTOL|nr:hypothetical protein Poli38472_012492 [Pythium oligandrum]|eukprot:TMW67376.1 hypothetical protein Poli38472_012492 [Pythium oligandrum]